MTDDTIDRLLPTGNESLTELALKLRLALKYILSKQEYIYIQVTRAGTLQAQRSFADFKLEMSRVEGTQLDPVQPYRCDPIG